jgi:hypothetical protein
VSKFNFPVADWSKPYLVPIQKTSCSLRETTIDRSIIKPEVRRELFASTMQQDQSKVLSRVSACLPVGFISFEIPGAGCIKLFITFLTTIL